jgi:DNA-directed RNA polymerase
MRCDWIYRLSQAREFRHRTFYFPLNLDWRGRAYPLPPHLNHLGSDLCRGLIKVRRLALGWV